MNLTDTSARPVMQSSLANGTEAGLALRNLIDQHGTAILADSAKLAQELETTSLRLAKKAQLKLFFSCDKVAKMAENAKGDLSIVDINNTMHSVLLETGLSYDATLSCTSDLLYALNLDYPILYGPRTVNGALEYNLHELMPVEIALQKEKEIEELYTLYTVSKEPTEEESKAYESKLNELCEAGVSKGFYYRGLQYYYGTMNSVVDVGRAMECFRIASDMGDSSSSVFLGDLYFFGNKETGLREDYTLAHYYYTRPVSSPLTYKQRVIRLSLIHEQDRINKKTIVFSVLFLVILSTFVILFHNGLFSGTNLLVVGILAIIGSIALFVRGILFNRVKKYNSIKRMLIAQSGVWMLYLFFLVLV